MKLQQRKYWDNVRITMGALFQGLMQTAKHFPKAFGQRDNVGIEQNNYFQQSDGLQTLLYPHEKLPVPDNGRYQLHNEIDDCIVCDKCAKVCPVDCIEIEPIRALEEIGKTSDGTTKRIHAAKFDIDMSKCCFCGLCTVVCPTECLTMTNKFDFSEFDVKNHNFVFGNMTPQEIEEKKTALEKYNEKKQAATTATSTDSQAIKSKPGKPVFRPKMKPIIKSETTIETNPEDDSQKKKVAQPKIKMKPVMKKSNSEGLDNQVEAGAEKVKPKFKPRPIIKKKKK